MVEKLQGINPEALTYEEMEYLYSKGVEAECNDGRVVRLWYGRLPVEYRR